MINFSYELLARGIRVQAITAGAAETEMDARISRGMDQNELTDYAKKTFFGI